MLIRMLLMLGITALFLSCLNDEHKGDADNSSNELSNQALNSQNNNKNNSPVEVIGTFSNRDGNGIHEWGYLVKIWSHDGHLIGMFSGAAGTRLVGDAPTGILQDVMYNFDTGIISFRATLPDVDYEFEGVLSKKKLSGRLFNMSGRLLSQRYDEAEKIVLLKSQELTAEMEEYPTLDAWKERMSELVKFRGVEGTVK